MEHQKYNANYLKVSKKDKEFIFNPNMQPKLSGIDRISKMMMEIVILVAKRR